MVPLFINQDFCGGYYKDPSFDVVKSMFSLISKIKRHQRKDIYFYFKNRYLQCTQQTHKKQTKNSQMNKPNPFQLKFSKNPVKQWK